MTPKLELNLSVPLHSDFDVGSQFHADLSGSNLGAVDYEITWISADRRQVELHEVEGEGDVASVEEAT